MKLSKYVFPFFALFVIFADELFYGFFRVTGTSLESGLKSREAIVIAGIAYVMLLEDIFKGRISLKNRKQLLWLFIILVLYGITGFFYPHDSSYGNYIARLLVYGALCIPSAYVGIKVARGGYDERILTLLPFFLIAVSLIVGDAVINSSMQDRLLGQEYDDVLNYQNSSYYLSFCAAYCVFHVFFNKTKRRTVFNTIVYIIIVMMIFLCAIGCILGGGRGAFVYLVVISAYLVYRIIQKRKKGKVGYLALLVVVALAMVYLTSHFQVFNSVGASRISESLTADDARIELWGKAMDSFKGSPIIGHGLGSVWWEVGFYSHNILADLLVETGIIGAFVIMLVIVKCAIKMIRFSRYNTLAMFILIVFSGVLVETAFSGYWLSSSKLFLAYGFAFGYALDSNRAG
jgi:O-antigen ligase